MMEFKQFVECLRAVVPFIPSSPIEGYGGAVFDKETGVLHARRYFGEIVVPLSNDIAEESIVFPKDIVSRLLKIPGSYSWGVGPKVTESEVQIKLKSLNIKFGRFDVPDIVIPEVGEPFPCTDSFFQTLGKVAEYMCQDDRKVNLYGIYIGDDGFYACDNVRIVKFASKIPQEFQKMFIPAMCVELIKNKHFEQVFCNDSTIGFISDTNIQSFQKTAAAFPDVEAVLSKVREADKQVLEIEDLTLAQEFSELMFDEMSSPPLTVRVEDNELVLSSFLTIGDAKSVVVKLKLLNEVPNMEFCVNGNCFMTGLLNFPSVFVGDRWVFFEEAGIAEYLVMQYAK